MLDGVFDAIFKLFSSHVEGSPLETRVWEEQEWCSHPLHHSETFETFGRTETWEVNWQRWLEVPRIKEIVDFLTLAIVENATTKYKFPELETGQTLVEPTDCNLTLAFHLKTSRQEEGRVLIKDNGSLAHFFFWNDIGLENPCDRTFWQKIENQATLTSLLFFKLQPKLDRIFLAGSDIIGPVQDRTEILTIITI